MRADMKTFYRSLLFVTLCGVTSALFAVSPFEPPGDNDGIAINQGDALIYPFSMTTMGILNGAAQVVVSVDANGHLSDTLVIAYTNEAFADAAVAALKRWTYEPARVRGVPRASRAYVLFTFKNDMGVMTQALPGMADASAVRAFSDDRYRYKAYQLRDLDRIPIPAKVVSPNPPKGSVAVKRTVTVEFYIDDQGRVRMPAVDRAEADDAYAAAAVRAVEQWHFEPPVRKGRPVLVLARQDFSFVPKP